MTRPAFTLSTTMILSPPFEFDEKTKEPFIRLAKHPNIIITPPRLSDAPALINLLNDERVVEWLSGPPFPYLQGLHNYSSSTTTP